MYVGFITSRNAQLTAKQASCRPSQEDCCTTTAGGLALVTLRVLMAALLNWNATRQDWALIEEGALCPVRLFPLQPSQSGSYGQARAGSQMNRPTSSPVIPKRLLVLLDTTNTRKCRGLNGLGCDEGAWPGVGFSRSRCSWHYLCHRAHCLLAFPNILALDAEHLSAAYLSPSGRVAALCCIAELAVALFVVCCNIDSQAVMYAMAVL